MATSDENDFGRPVGELASEERSTSRAARHRIRRARLVKWLFTLIVLVAAGYFLMPLVSEHLQGMAASEETSGPSTYTVNPRTLVLSVTEDGNVESASNKEIKCPIEGGSTILWIVEDGKEVSEGEELVHLDASSIEDKLNSQKIVHGNALTSQIQAEKDVEVGEISIEEYLNGTFKIQVQDAEAQITIAMENLRTAQNLLAFSEKNSRKGFVTPLQLEADQFAVKRSQLELDSAQTAQAVLEKYEKAKMLKDLESKLATAKAKLSSEEAALALEKSRLDRLEKQLGECIIKAPQAGMVVYANDAGRMRFSQQSAQIEEGAMVRERQALIRLPDLKNMQVRVTVHESKVEQIHPGLPAKVVIGDDEFKGEVVSVANQPEAGGWFSANVKEYATIVKIEGDRADLKPGMSAEVTIFIDKRENVLAIPVQCSVEQGGKFYCWLQTPEGPERRAVELGATNDTYIEIRDGVKAGDTVLLNPRTYVSEASQDESLSESARQKDADAEKYGGTLKEMKPERLAQKTGGRGAGRPMPARGADSTSEPGAARGTKKGPGGSGRANLMSFDKDGDGKVSKSEVPEQMQRMFDFVDTNKDGGIDKQEAEAAAKRRPQGGRGGAPGQGGREGGSRPESGAGGPGGGARGTGRGSAERR